jgi:cyclopropane fatty-acyl-phospholipid synthase-like methyltransferase
MTLRILELGSGPGQLARAILERCDVDTYVALDFSPAMHAIAAEHLGELAHRVTFDVRDFREAAWAEGLGAFDAVVTRKQRTRRAIIDISCRCSSELAP